MAKEPVPMKTRTLRKILSRQKMHLLLPMLFLCMLCGCRSTDSFNLVDEPHDFSDLVDESETTADGALIRRKYKGKVMYFTEKLLSEDKSICVTSIYCGYGTEPHMVRARIYLERKKVEYKFGDHQYFEDEYVSFRQECITTVNAMVLMLETRDENGELVKAGYISQWESAEYFDKFCKENRLGNR